MKQIERYIFRRIATLTFWSLMAATMLVMTTQVLIRVDVLTTTSQALLAFLMLSATLIPSVVTVVAPFALLIGVSQVLSGMNSDSELVVIEAAGVRPMTVLKPVMVLSVSFSILVLLISNFVEPWSNRKLYSVLAQAQSDLFSVAVRSGSFMKLEDGLYIQINEKLPGGELGGIFLSDTRTEGKEAIYYAKSGVIRPAGDNDILLLIEGELQQRDLVDNHISIVSFSSYALDMAAFVPARAGAILRPKEQPTSYLLNPPADDHYFKSVPFVFKEELVGRFTTWMYPLAFGFIAFTFLGKARSNRHEQFQNGLLVAGIALGARGFGFYSVDAAGKSVFMEVLSYGVPATLIAVFGFLALTGRTLTIPKAWARLNDRIIEAVTARAARWQRWRNAAQDGHPV